MASRSTPAILVVDDDEANRYAKARMLRQAGYVVLEAATGGEALHLVAAERPDLVCLDVKLPDVNGHEVCRRIKSDSANRIMVLQMSASFIGQEDKVRGLEGGADGYLTSPTQPEEFLATVRSLLRIREAEAQLREAARQWRVTFDAIQDGIALLDERGVVLRCNRAWSKLLSQPFDEIVGRPCTDLLLFDPRAGAEQGLKDLVHAASRQETTITVGNHWYRLAVDPVMEEGVRCGAVCIVTDITDRRRQDEEIRKLNASLQERIDELQRSRRELQEKILDLEKFEQAVVGRELKMMEMETEIKRLKAKLAER
ncbi:response regulator [Candidatus Nitrospira bockiana]